MKTKIFYDLINTQFKIKNENGIIFYFSSKLHKDKFMKTYKRNREIISSSLSKRFKFEIELSNLSDLILYRKIESRGFLISIEGRATKCQEFIILNGDTVTLKK